MIFSPMLVLNIIADVKATRVTARRVVLLHYLVINPPPLYCFQNGYALTYFGKFIIWIWFQLDYPLNQTCCGQPMANAGFENKAVDLARHFDEQFKNYDYIVGPSASCVVFVRDNYSRLLKEDKHRCASEGKIYDICEFIHDIVKPSSLKKAEVST